MSWPRILADALIRPTVAPVLRPTTGDRCGASLEEACHTQWRPAEWQGTPPPWLRVHQHEPWRRAAAALHACRGALIAEPVGAGKTWIGLALASTFGGAVTVIAPAVLLPQWRRAADTVLRRVQWHSLERCSRGTPPAAASDLVIIDEAHRLRHPGTRRAKVLAEWLGTRRVVLLTATPIVNRLNDLVALLRYIAPSDALRLDGIADIGDLQHWHIAHPALRRLVIRTAGNAFPLPVHRRTFGDGAAETVRASRAATIISGLRLSPERPIRRLLRGVLADAAASSDAAWHAALRRYRGLLLQSVEAGGVSRAMLRQFAGADGDQGVWWNLVAPEAVGAAAPLPSDDLPRVEQALRIPASDTPWLRALEGMLADDVVTIAFCRHRATAVAVRRHLGDGVAWVSGDGAGIGPHRMARPSVLEAFGPRRAAWKVRRQPPHLLVATDVAAEGLDLQAAGRVIHLDLPWTAMRRDQRDGRLLRPGQAANAVEIIERRPAPPLERILALGDRVDRKQQLASRWLDSLASASPMYLPEPCEPTCDVTTLVLVQLRHGERGGAVLVGLRAHEADVVPAAEVPAILGATRGWRQLAPGGLSAADRQRALRAAHDSGGADGRHRILIRRIHLLARRLGQARDAVGLAALDRLLGHAIRGASTGTQQVLERLAVAPDASLLHHRLPALPPAAPIVGRVIAAATCLRSADSLRCADADLPDRTVRS